MTESLSGKVGTGFPVRQADKRKVPALRFPEFAGEWDAKPIGQRLSKVVDYRGKAPPKAETGMPLITARNVRMGHLDFSADEYIDADLYEGWMNRGLPKPDDVLFTTEAPLGNVAQYPHEGTYALGQRIITLQPDPAQLTSGFLFQFLIGPIGQKKVDKRGTGSTAKGIKSKVFVKIPMAAPEVPEQKKIAAFLGVVDEKLAALRARRAGLETYKRGLMQKLFSRTLRFTKPDGSAFSDWEEKRLGEVFERVTRKNVEDNQNVLTISAQQGLVNQREYFNKSVSAQDVSGYYLLHKGDFAYNKSYSKGYPMGAIKRLSKYEKGVVSTLYICFAPLQPAMASFYEQFFESGGLDSEIRKIAQEGARNHGLLNMSVVEFFKDMILPVPHPDEQALIANALQAMDAKVSAVADQIARMEAFKKGLLQQMFV